MDSLESWFGEWIRCNDYLRSHFPVLRALYRQQGGRPLATLVAFTARVDLTPIDSFIDISRRFPDYLTGL
jgi:hypothetical protein